MAILKSEISAEQPAVKANRAAMQALVADLRAHLAQLTTRLIRSSPKRDDKSLLYSISCD